MPNVFAKVSDLPGVLEATATKFCCEFFCAVLIICSAIQPAPKTPHRSGLDSSDLKRCGLGSVVIEATYLYLSGLGTATGSRQEFLL